MQIYKKINEKCYISWFSSISQRILIMFVLSDRAGWGLQNFYTELWNSINYAHLCKFIQNQWKMLHLLILLFRSGYWFCLFYLIGLGGGFKTSTLNCDIHSSCKWYAGIFVKNQWQMLHRLYFEADLPSMFVLSDRAWVGPYFKKASRLNFRRIQLSQEQIVAGCKLVKIGVKYRYGAPLCHGADYRGFCLLAFIGAIVAGASITSPDAYVTYIIYVHLCKFIQNHWKMLHLLYFAADFDYVCFIW